MGIYLPLRLCIVVSLILHYTEAEICTSPVCEYTFVLRRWRTMTYTTGDVTYPVGLNGTRLQVVENSYNLKATDAFIGSFVDANDVITGDGFVRDIITINDQFPGPNLQVMAGAQVVVHVDNRLAFEVTAIHWHGMYMKGTPWMDGTAYISQCPILPRQMFTYRFIAEPHGTHWYHAHMVAQRMDGLYGMLVIHPTVPSTPEYLVTVTDWLHEDSIRFDNVNPFNVEKKGTGDLVGHLLSGLHFMADNAFSNIVRFNDTLMNGRGRWQDSPYPLEHFPVNAGQTYRFRVVNVALESGFEVSIDGHAFNIIALDGHPIVPLTGLHSVLIFPGDAMDLTIIADQKPDLYWIRAVVRRVGMGPYPKPDGLIKQALGIIQYTGTVYSADTDPITEKMQCNSITPCRMFNCLYLTHPTNEHTTCIGMADIRSMHNHATLSPVYGLDDPNEEIEEHFINFDFTNLHIALDNKRFILNRAPMYKEDFEKYMTPCTQECNDHPCSCTNVLELPYNKTIQLVIASHMPNFPANTIHSLHMHGHDFAVIKVGYAAYNNDTGFWDKTNNDIRCSSKTKGMCNPLTWSGSRPEFNTNVPAIRNTVGIPSNGYVVIRFRSTNPGYWLLHCHMDQHFIDGMGMILGEAPTKQPPPPENLPNCGDFLWTGQQFSDYIEASRSLRENEIDERTERSTTTTEQPFTTVHSADPEINQLIQVKLNTAIGIVFGLVLLGAVPTLCVITLYACINRRRRAEDKG